MTKHLGIIRLVGKLFLVSGFFFSLYGLSDSSTFLINISLGLLAIGIGIMFVNFYYSLKSRGPDRGPSEWTGTNHEKKRSGHER